MAWLIPVVTGVVGLVGGNRFAVWQIKRRKRLARTSAPVGIRYERE